MIPPEDERQADLALPPVPADASHGPIGTRTFTIEGRAAPGLFVVAWLATILGAAVLFVSFQTSQRPAQLVLALLGLLLLAAGLIAGAGSQGIERRARAIAAYRGPSPILVFAASVPVVLLLGSAVGLLLSLVGVDLETPAAIVIGASLQVVVYLGLVRLVVVDTRALSWREMGVVRPTAESLREFLIGAAWSPAIVVLTALIGGVLVQIFDVIPSAPLEPAGEPVGFAANLIVAVVLAPVGEELFFRGFATTAWSRATGLRGAIIRGGLFFAFVHVLTITVATASEALPVALIAFVSRIPIGLLLGWLFLRRGNIWAPLGLHAAFNAILIVLAEASLDAPTG